MRKSNGKGSAPTRKDLSVGYLVGDREYRLRWAVTFMLAAIASVLLAGMWFLREGGSSFKVGSPALQAYYAHSRMRIVDENATRALKNKGCPISGASW